jgi:hypothetical protein
MVGDHDKEALAGNANEGDKVPVGLSTKCHETFNRYCFNHPHGGTFFPSMFNHGMDITPIDPSILEAIVNEAENSDVGLPFYYMAVKRLMGGDT